MGAFLTNRWGLVGFALVATGATGLFLALGSKGSMAAGPLAVGLWGLAGFAGRRRRD